jgi:signal transduction histidine kinase
MVKRAFISKATTTILPMLAHTIVNPSQLFLLCLGAANLTIGICVLIRNPSHVLNRSFFLFVLGCVAWSTGVSLLYITHDFVFDKLALGGGFLMYFGLTLFARIFPSESKMSPRFFLIFIPLCIAVIFLPFNLFIKAIHIDAGGFVQPINGPLFPVFVAVTIGYISISLYLFVRSFRKSAGKSRLQMFYLLTGITIFMASLALFDAILPSCGIYKLNLFGPAASFIFLFMTGYAILRHQLMDIRVVIQRSTIYSLLFSIIIASYLVAMFVTRIFFEDYLEIVDPFFDSLILLFAIVTLPKLERYFRKVTNRFFFKDPYDYASVLDNLSKILNTTIQTKRLTFELLEALDATMHPETIEFFHISTGSIFSYSQKRRSVRKDIPNSLPEHGTVVTVCVDAKPIGFFTLGKKRSGDPYTTEDHRLFRTFSAQAAVAFEKAELYRELEDYSISLEEKVRMRTLTLEEVRESQRQFFDDISHALQTPLTILKSSIELLKSNELPREIHGIQLMEQSTDDLSRLIREILRLARMDAMPVQKDQVPFNLSYLIQKVIEYVEVISWESGIVITSEITPDAVLMGNEMEIEEALANLLSNAVQHTSHCNTREIHIDLMEGFDCLELCISDTGVGIATEKLSHIFERFYRSSGGSNTGETGHGLGLAITKRIVERHGGKILVESEIGKGTQFILSFPIVPPSLIDVPVAAIQA